MNKHQKMDTRAIVFGAFIVTIAFLIGGGFQRVTGIPTVIKINVGGASQNIGFTAVPLIMGSIMLGPVAGGIVAAIYDTLSYLLITGGVWNPIFTLSEIIVGIVPALIYRWFKKHPDFNLLKATIATLGLYTIAVVLLSNVMAQGATAGQKSIQMISFEGGFRVVNMVLLVAFVCFYGLSVGLTIVLSKKRKQEGLFSFDKLLIVSFIAILLRSLISGYGLYLYLGKTVPLIFYWLPRFVTPMFLAPITAFMISCLGYILERYTR